MNETHLPSEEDRNWQDQEQARDEAFMRHEVEEVFRRLFIARSIYNTDTDDWELLAQALEDRFPNFLKFYRSL